MRVVREGIPWATGVTCPDCESELQVEARDLRVTTEYEAWDQSGHRRPVTRLSAECPVCTCAVPVPVRDVPEAVFKRLAPHCDYQRSCEASE